jgi:hypothetical protein
VRLTVAEKDKKKKSAICPLLWSSFLVQAPMWVLLSPKSLPATAIKSRLQLVVFQMEFNRMGISTLKQIYLIPKAFFGSFQRLMMFLVYQILLCTMVLSPSFHFFGLFRLYVCLTIPGAHRLVTPSDDPFSAPLDALKESRSVGLDSAYIAMQEALRGFKELSAYFPTAFIYTGNTLNQIAIPGVLPFALGKVAAAMLIEYGANAYGSKGYRYITHLLSPARTSETYRKFDLCPNNTLIDFTTPINASLTGGLLRLLEMARRMLRCIGSSHKSRSRQSGR